MNLLRRCFPYTSTRDSGPWRAQTGFIQFLPRRHRIPFIKTGYPAGIFSRQGSLKIAIRKAVSPYHSTFADLAALTGMAIAEGEKRKATYCFGGESQQRKKFPF